MDASVTSHCLCLLFFFTPPTLNHQIPVVPVDNPHRRQTHPDLRAGTVCTDYSNKETASVLLQQSNFAINCLPGCLVAERQIPLHSGAQKPPLSPRQNPLTFNHAAVLQCKALTARGPPLRIPWTCVLAEHRICCWSAVFKRSATVVFLCFI